MGYFHFKGVATIPLRYTQTHCEVVYNINARSRRTWTVFVLGAFNTMPCNVLLPCRVTERLCQSSSFFTVFHRTKQFQMLIMLMAYPQPTETF